MRVNVREGFEPLPLNRMLEKSARLHGSRVALRKRRGDAWNEYSYARLSSSVKRVARFLTQSGRKKGDHIGILGENSPEWMVAYWACLWSGAVAVPLDARAKEAELTPILAHADITCIFVDLRHLSLVERVNTAGSLDIALVTLEEGPRPNIPTIVATFEEDQHGSDVELGDLAMIVYTSGTTGDAKGVMLTHGNVVSNMNSVYKAMLFGEEDRFFSVLPLSHMYECTAGECLPLCAGASVTYARSLKPREMLEDIRDTRPTIMLAVPLLLEKVLAGIRRNIRSASLPTKCALLLMEAGAVCGNTIWKGRGSAAFFESLRERMGFGSLRFFVSGGAALPPSAQIGLEHFGFKVLQGYGLTETAPIVTWMPEGPSRPGCAGQPLPDVTVKIVNPNREGLGEVAVKGPNVMKGYYKNDGETKRVFDEEGYFLTGDVGYFADNDFLYLTGRSKSMIVTKGGLNIFPEEVEGVMLESPLIEEIMVVGGRNERTGDEEIQAVVYPNTENVLSHFSRQGVTHPAPDDVKALLQCAIEDCGKKLASYKRIRSISLRETEFPKTAINKIRRHLCQDRPGPESESSVTR